MLKPREMTYPAPTTFPCPTLSAHADLSPKDIAEYSGGFRILKRGVRIIWCAKSRKNFCLTMPTFSETMPRPLNLQSISSACARTKSKVAVL